MKNISKLAAMLLLIAPLAAAQEPRVYRDGNGWSQEITGSLAAAKNLRVKVNAGGVRVEGAAQQNISYVIHTRSYSSSEDQARQEFNSYKISANVRGDTAWIVADWQGGRPRKFSGDFVVRVPREMEFAKLETGGGGVNATGIQGRVDVACGGGSVHLDDIGGAINAETGGGSIEVGSAGSAVNLHTGGGSIRVNSAKGKITLGTGGGSVQVISGLQGGVLETGGGRIEVQRCNGPLKVSTGGGDIDLGSIDGTVEMETGGGSLRLISAKGAVRAETGGGNIELNGVPSVRAETGAGGIVAKFVAGAGRTDSLLETSVGDITVYLAPTLNVTIRATIEAANGHSIQSDFSEFHITTEGGQWGPKSITAEGSLNGGGPILKVSTTSGDIVFRRGQ